MSYHGPRDNGEGRASSEPDPPAVPIPESFRIASTAPPSSSVIQLLRRTPRPRSRSPHQDNEHSTTREESDEEPLSTRTTSRRQPLFRPGTFGLTAPIQQSTMAIESAIIAALDVTPRHLKGLFLAKGLPNLRRLPKIGLWNYDIRGPSCYTATLVLVPGVSDSFDLQQLMLKDNMCKT